MPINKRLIELFVVLNYDSYKYESTGRKYFTDGERICINQERGYIMSQQFEYHDKYIQSPSVNEKIEFVKTKIHEDNFYDAYELKAENLLKEE